MKKILGTIFLFAALAGPAMADGDAAKGEKLFKKCKACHAIGEGAKNKVGPEQNDLFGRTAGGLESFGKKYSKAMKAAGEEGLVWNEDTLKEYLAKPKAFIKGTKMSFAGFKKEQDLDDIAAYLLTFSPNYVPAEGDDAAPEEATAEEATTSK